MKNLFDFATKELSQDAFLRWFFENYDDEELGPIVVDFINTFTKGQNKNSKRKPLDLVFGDIEYIETFAQLNNIDVSVDIYAKQYNGQHKTIVIEDKTDSEEHKQLETYNKKIKGWNEFSKLTPDECVYKVFYKTNPIKEKERARIEAAGWTSFDIEAIYDFFKGKGNTKSQIFNDYVEHIEEIYSNYYTVSKKPLRKWVTSNWETFLRENMAKDFPGVKFYTTTFRKIYDSMIVNYDVPYNKVLKCSAFEIKIRSRLELAIRPSYNRGDKYVWSINDIKNEDDKKIAQEEVTELRKFVDNQKSSIIQRANTVRTFAKAERIPYKAKTAEELWEELRKYISEYVRIMSSFALNKKR